MSKTISKPKPLLQDTEVQELLKRAFYAGAQFGFDVNALFWPDLMEAALDYLNEHFDLGDNSS